MTDAVKFGKTGFIAGAGSLGLVDYLEAQKWALATGSPLSQPLGEGPDYLHLQGNVEVDRVRAIMDEKSRPEPVLVETDMIEKWYPSKKVFTLCQSFRPTKRGPTDYHDFEMLLQIIGEAYDGTYGTHRRHTAVHRLLLCGGNSFSKVGKVLADLPVGVMSGLRNGGFELSFLYWTQNSATIETSIVKVGSKSAKLQASGTAVDGAETEHIAVDAGRLCAFSVWYHVSAYTAGNFQILVTFYDSGKTSISSSTLVNKTSTTAEWTQFTYTIGPGGSLSFPSGTRFVKFLFRWTTTPTGVAYVDEFSFDLSVQASKATDYVAFTRLTADGAIPFVEDPLVSLIHYDVLEADLGKGNVAFSKDAYGQRIADSAVIRLRDQTAQASNKGRWLLEIYDTDGWLEIGTIGFAVKSSSKDLEYFDDKAPLVELGFNEKLKIRDALLASYPASAVQKYKVRSHLLPLRGRPFTPLLVSNWGGPLVEAHCKINISLTSLRYYTRAGSTLDAVGTTYGENLQAGDADDNLAFYLSNESTPSKTALQVGFICLKKADRDYRANDAGNYWDSITLTWDNLDVGERGLPFPLFVIFAQRQGSAGNRTPANLEDEAVVNLFTPQWVSEAV